MPSLGLTARFVAAMVAAVLLSAVAGMGLWAHDHTARRDAALDAHAQQVLQDLAAALEARLALGLPPAQLPGVDRLLSAARRQLPAARSAAVLDDKGRTLFSTDPVEVGDETGGFRTDNQAGDGRLIVGDDEIFWRRVAADDGGVAGFAVLHLSAGAADDGATTFVVALAVRAAPALAALAVLAALAGVWAAQVAGRRAAVTAAALGRLAGDPSADIDGETVAHGLREVPLAGFAAAAAARRRVLATAEEELGRLDETA